MLKRLVCACLLICMIFSLIACNTEEKKQTESQTMQSSSQNTSEKGTETQEPAKIVFWDMAWGPATTYPKVVETVAKKFEEVNANAKVEVQQIAWANNYQIFLTAISSGTAPDVATTSSALPIQFNSMGALASLNSILDEWKIEGKYDDIEQADYDTFTFDGEVVALPWQIEPRAFFYRKDVFEKAGVKKLPENWNEFLDALRKIKQNTDFIPFVSAGTGSFAHHVFYHFQILNNTGLVTQDIKADMGSNSNIEVLEFLNTLVKDGLVPESMVSYQLADAQKLFYSGKAAVILAAPDLQMLQYPEVSENTAVLPVFKAPNGIKASPGWTNPILVFKQSKNVDMAKQFTKYYCDNILPVFTQSGIASFPVKKSLLSDPYFSSNWLLKGISDEVLPYTLPGFYPAKSYYPAYSQINGEDYAALALQKVLTAGGKADCKAIAEEINQMVDKAIVSSKK